MHPEYAHLRHDDLVAAATAHRLARSCRRRRPPLALRLYARVWWASRPRAVAWAPALLDARW